MVNMRLPKAWRGSTVSIQTHRVLLIAYQKCMMPIGMAVMFDTIGYWSEMKLDIIGQPL